MTHFVIIKGRNGREALCKWVGHSLKVKIEERWLPIDWRDFGGEGHVLTEWQGD